MDREIEQSRLTIRPWMYVAMGGILLLAIAVVAVRSGSNSEVRIDASTVVVSKVEKAPFQEMVAVDGTVQPNRTVIMDALIGGVVSSRLVENGALLHAGDSVLLLENSDLQLDILNKETAVFELITNIQFTRNSLEQNRVTRLTQLADVEYQLLEASRNWKVVQQLYQSDAVARQEYEQAEATAAYYNNKRTLLKEAVTADSMLAFSQIQQMEMSLTQAKKNLDLMRLKLEDLVVRAPIAGQLSGFTAEVGQLIAKGDNIGQLDVLDRHKVSAQIGEHFNSRVAVGQKAHFELGGQRYDLEVERIYPTIVNNMFSADLRFTGKAPAGIKRGQNLLVRVELSGVRESVIVPRGGFFQSTGGQWVFVIDPDTGKATKRTIRIGRQNPTHFEVLDGLMPGESVITSGYHTYSEYETVWLES